MNSFAAFLASLALALSPATGDPAGGDEVARAAPEGDAPQMGLSPRELGAVQILEQARQVPVQRQVRIEQRVILRISPPSGRTREQMMADLPRRPQGVVFTEVEGDRCVRMNSIVAVQPTSENRLLLYMRDRTILSAALERACAAEDFYSGFYVERSDDGRLCSRRDRLQSRSGAVCEVSKFYRVVATGD